MWTKAEIRGAIALALIAGMVGATVGYMAGPSIMFGATVGFLLFAFSTALGTLIEFVTTRDAKS